MSDLQTRLANLLKRSDFSFPEQLACVAALEMAAISLLHDADFHRLVLNKYGTQVYVILLEIETGRPQQADPQT